MSDSFSDWTAKIAEALCVEHGIHCKRKFTDAELERPRAEIRAGVQRDQLQRHEGSGTQYRSGGFGGYEMNTRGGMLKPGQ